MIKNTVTKTVEVTEDVYIAKDGKEFSGANAKQECKYYEKNLNLKKLENEFKRLDVKEIYNPIAEYWYGDYAELWKVRLNSYEEYITLIEYLKECEYKNDVSIDNPGVYPYEMLVAIGSGYAEEYGDTEFMISQLKRMIEELEE